VLPDVSRLSSVAPAAWAELGARVRASGLDGRFLARVMRVGERVDDAMRAPMRLWTLRRAPEPAAAAARMLMFGDPVEEERAGEILGALEPWLDAGLLAREAGGVVSPFRLALTLDRFVLADDLAAGGDAVMGPSATTIYACVAAMPAAPVGSVLDVGCGAGSIAIALADRAERVVATDVSARALVLAAASAHMNRARLDLRRGDLFEPARERFDRIVSQPPFVARPPGDEDAPFLFGGARGDELALRLLAGVRDRLTDVGRALVLVDFPVVDGDPIEERVSRAVGRSAVLVLASPARNLEDHCALHAAAAHPELGPAFSRAAMAMRDHLEAQGVRALRLCLVVIERAPAFTALVSVSHFADAPPTDAAVTRHLAAQFLLAGPDEALLDARLRVPPGTSVDAPAAMPDVVVVRPPRDRLIPPFSADAAVAALAQRVSDAGTARAAKAAPRDVRDALARGLLEVTA